MLIGFILRSVSTFRRRHILKYFILRDSTFVYAKAGSYHYYSTGVIGSRPLISINIDSTSCFCLIPNNSVDFLNSPNSPKTCLNRKFDDSFNAVSFNPDDPEYSVEHLFGFRYRFFEIRRRVPLFRRSMLPGTVRCRSPFSATIRLLFVRVLT